MHQKTGGDLPTLLKLARALSGGPLASGDTNSDRDSFSIIETNLKKRRQRISEKEKMKRGKKPNYSAWPRKARKKFPTALRKTALKGAQTAGYNGSTSLKIEQRIKKGNCLRAARPNLGLHYREQVDQNQIRESEEGVIILHWSP